MRRCHRNKLSPTTTFFVPLFFFLFLLISGVRSTETVTCRSPTNDTADLSDQDYCYYFIRVDSYFEIELGWSQNGYYSLHAGDKLFEACSAIKYDDPTTNFYGITFGSGRYPTLEVPNYTTKQALFYIEVLFYCCKDCNDIKHGEVLDVLSNLFYHKLLQYHRRKMTLRNDVDACKYAKYANESFFEESCLAVIEGKNGFASHFQVGQFRPYTMAQLEVSDVVGKDFTMHGYKVLAMEGMPVRKYRFCRAEYLSPSKDEYNPYLNRSECITFSSPQLYYQLCCCGQNLTICGSMENELTNDPITDMESIAEKEFTKDEWNELNKYQLDRIGMANKYRKKRFEQLKRRVKIMCAIGRVKIFNNIHK